MGNIFNKKVGTRASATGYNNFLRVYRQQHTEMEPNDAIVSAARAWSELSVKQKHRYGQMGTASRQRIYDLRDVLQSAVQIAQPAGHPKRKRKPHGPKKNHEEDSVD